ncbi:MAG TPA: lysine exporter LysO family protein [Williamwhitmania sp.]|nr:lysine exporter LysO family protein [Williamwhitmania sp.]
MKGSLIILSFFAVGVLFGYVHWLPAWLLHGNFTEYALYLLMFLVGIGIGSDPRSLQTIRSMNLTVLLVPLTTIVGTLIGVSCVSLLISDISLKDVAAIGSGFGYYSLSSIYITEIRGGTLGVVALLSNVMREIITLLFTPIFARYFGKLAPIACGGATSMDTTLPIITQYVGKDYAVISLLNGTILTVLVPFLVTFILV